MTRRRKKIDFQMLPLKLLMGGFRLGIRVWEPFAPPEKKQKIRAMREQMAIMEQDRQELLRKMDETSDGQEMTDLANHFQDRYEGNPSPERAAQREEHREAIRAIRQEGEDLKAIVDTWGNDTEEAIREFRGYLAAHPDSGSAHSYLGIAFQKRGQWNESIAAYIEAERLAEHPASANFTRLHIGDVLQEKGDLEAAVAQYRHVINSSPRGEPGAASLAYLRMGNALQGLGQTKEARAAWKQALHTDDLNVVSDEARKKLAENL